MCFYPFSGKVKKSKYDKEKEATETRLQEASDIIQDFVEDFMS